MDVVYIEVKWPSLDFIDIRVLKFLFLPVFCFIEYCCRKPSHSGELECSG